MSLVFYLKKNLNKLPIGITFGNFISRIPYKYRPGIGDQYSKSQKEITEYRSLQALQKQDLVFQKIKKLCSFAYEQVHFYKNYYDENKFHPSELNSFEDLQKIPITSKRIFQKYSLEARSSKIKGSKSNTGGSTGKPLDFYTSPQAIGHQWAHLHKAWGTIGYSPTDLKVIFAGRSNVKGGTEYDLIRHSIGVDIYTDFRIVADQLLEFTENHAVKFLHGYPSALFEFCVYCEENEKVLIERLQKTLVGIILNSEYPTQKFRKKIESLFQVPSLATYGHTERCIIAYEKERQNNYHVMQTYGYAEVINNQLIGTSYYSFGTPFIRYNTEDEVDSFSYKNDLLESFKITEGRKGEFVVDKKGKKISLTGLIFGRHHDLFDFCDFIQVFQEKIGKLLILYTTEKDVSPVEAAGLFDNANIDMDLEFKQIGTPYKTPSGKVLLKLHCI